ncbi:MAG: TIGR03619 family F420-dependent LLM class oxidoreductase [Dehalococcoidia bacterium]|nr:TIGR03619 family F420-dependent LLM class oxidoreductase [Dehalococcoidia bacterium]
MKLGVTLPNGWGVDDPQQSVTVARLVEDRGLDSVWVQDHLFNVGFIRDRLEDRPYWHPLATLTAVAVQTSRITLGSSVLVLPYHNPIDLAKYIATLDHFSNGRTVIGVGVGALEPEFRALGIPMSQRAALTDEALELMKELWTSTEPAFASERWQFSEVKFSPKCYQQPHVPIWVGGNSAGARRRAARLGDAWHPLGGDPAAVAEQFAGVRKMAEQAGRDPGAVGLTFRVTVAAQHQGSSYRPVIGDATTADAIVDLLNRYAEIGVEHVVLGLDIAGMEAITDVVEYVAAEIKPQI